MALSDPPNGITLNVGVISGGQTVNTIAPWAKGEVDLRFITPAQRDATLAKVEAIMAKSYVPGTSAKIEITGEFVPLVETADGKALYEHYAAALKELGVAETTALFTGGCADSGFASAAGTPTICAVGPVGGRAHSPDEYLEIDTIDPARPGAGARGAAAALGGSMIPWSLLDTAQVPGGGELRLKQRGAEFSIMLGQNELMNSRLSGSEEALATIACERIRDRKAPRILIGGLGMGFTLRAALGRARPGRPDRRRRTRAGGRGMGAGADGGGVRRQPDRSAGQHPRSRRRSSDPRRARRPIDAILLDVDNGPEGLTRKTNDALYDLKGLSAARAALRPGGVLAVWSSTQNPKFTWRLGKAGFAVEEVRARANGSRGGARHVIWIATRS